MPIGDWRSDQLGQVRLVRRCRATRSLAGNATRLGGTPHVCKERHAGVVVTVTIVLTCLKLYQRPFTKQTQNLLLPAGQRFSIYISVSREIHEADPNHCRTVNSPNSIFVQNPGCMSNADVIGRGSLANVRV